jgi:hypothetical protein
MNGPASVSFPNSITFAVMGQTIKPIRPSVKLVAQSPNVSVCQNECPFAAVVAKLH